MLVAKPIIGFYKRSIARSAFMVHVMPVMAEVILSNHYSLMYNIEAYMQDIFSCMSCPSNSTLLDGKDES